MVSNFQNFKVKSTFKGNKASTWNINNFNNHMIKVTNDDNQESITFEFWASIAKPTISTDYDLLNAFYCFIGDCASGVESFEDFCSNFGYDNDSREAKQIHKACKKSLTKFCKLMELNKSDCHTILWELYNNLADEYA
jgi:hypothetical protein